MIAFLTGPMLWVSLAVFFIGLTVRAVMYVRGLNWKLDRVAYRPNLGHGLKGAIQSIYRWLTPAATRSWRTQPFMMVGFFLFHIGAIVIPLFLIGHNVLLEQNFGISLPTIPSVLADIITVGAIIGGVMLGLRRVALTEVRILTTTYDWFILGLSLAPFVTGLLARLHVAHYDFWLVAHIITGEAVLILAPFTKLSHIILFFFSRGQLGMDFSIKRGGMSRGTAFPW